MCFHKTLWSKQFSDSLRFRCNQLFRKMGHSKIAFFFSLRAEMMKALPNLFCPSPPQVMHLSVCAHISPLLLIHTDYVFISADMLWLKEPCFWCILKDFGEYQESYYSVQTTEGEQISQLIAGYIDIILKKASATKKKKKKERKAILELTY